MHAQLIRHGKTIGNLERRYIGSTDAPLASHPNVTMVDVPMMDISSSYIRRCVAEHRDVRYLLTEPVYNYLTEMHFYER